MQKDCLYVLISLQLGLMLMLKHYRGGPWMKLTVACLIIKGEITILSPSPFLNSFFYIATLPSLSLLSFPLIPELILHPLTPVYLIVKASTYKSYLLSTIMSVSHPRHDMEAPEEYKNIAEDFVRGVQSAEDEYDRNTFVLRRKTVILDK